MLLHSTQNIFPTSGIPNELISLPGFSCCARFVISSSKCHGFLHLYLCTSLHTSAVCVYSTYHGRVYSFRLGVFTVFWTHMSSRLSFENKSHFLPVFCSSFCVQPELEDTIFSSQWFSESKSCFSFSSPASKPWTKSKDVLWIQSEEVF